MNRRLLAGLGVAALVALVAVGIRRLTSGSAAESEQEVSPVVAVHVAAIVRTTLHEYVDTWGTVEPEPASARRGAASARIAPPVAGLLAEVRCAEGARVSQGALLFSIDPRVGDVAVTRARQAVRFAEGAFERQKALGPGEATSQRLYQEAEQNLAAARSDLATAEAQRNLLDLRAPLSGTVVKLNARPGDAVDPTTVLAEIIDLDRLVVAATVRSGDAPRIRAGQAVFLSARDSTPATSPSPRPLPSRIVLIGDAVDTKTDTVTVRAALPPHSGLRPGQFLDVRILVDEHRDCLAAPIEGLVMEGGAPALAVIDGDKAVKRPVRPGLREGPLVEVEGDGIREGLRVVAAGAYGLPRETKIRVIEP